MISMISLTVSVRPVVVEAVPHLGVDGRHRLHVRLAPLSPEVFGLQQKVSTFKIGQFPQIPGLIDGPAS